MRMHDNRFIQYFPQVQCQYQPLQATTSSTTSNISLLNTPSFNFSSKNYVPMSLCHQNINGNDDQSTYMGQNVVSPSSGIGCINENRSLVQLLWADQNQMFQFNNINAKNFEFGSVISTPSASTSHLNLSTTHVNNGSTEDEKDTYCNNIMFDYHMALDFDGFM